MYLKFSKKPQFPLAIGSQNAIRWCLNLLSICVMKQNLTLRIAFVLLAGLTVFFVAPRPVKAAQLAETIIRLNRMKASTATGGSVCVKMTTTAGTDAKLKVTFPSGFTVNGTASNWTVSTSDLPAGGTAMPGIATASVVSGQTVTFPITDISSAATLYCFNFTGTSTLTTDTAGSDKTGSISVTTSADAQIDGGIFATAVIADDQVTVTASVPATFSLALGTNSQALGTLSSGSVSSGSGVSFTIGTNASNGWYGWVLSANEGLTSASTGDEIQTSGALGSGPTAISAGTEGYVLDANLTTDSATSGTGTVTIDAEYNGTTTSEGGTLSALFQPFASANGPTDADIITLIPRVAISALTLAATDYTDTLTIVAAGNF